MLCPSRVHRDGRLKVNHSLALLLVLLFEKQVTFNGKSIMFGASMFDEPQPRPLFYGHTSKKRFDLLFSNLDWVALLLGENDAFLIHNTPSILVINKLHVYEILITIFLY